MNKSEESTIKSLVSGSVAGGLTQLVFSPIDVLKVRAQAMGRGQIAVRKTIGLKEISSICRMTMKNEGVKGFFAGAKQGVFGAGMAWGLYFVIYNKFKSGCLRVKPRDSNELSYFELLCSSLFSGVSTAIFLHPIWLMKTRMQLNALNAESHKYKSTLDGVRKIIRADGFRGLFVGLPASLLLVSHGVVFFILYDKLKYAYFKRTKRKTISPRAALVLSMFCKFTANLVSYPFSVTKTRYQDQKNTYDKVQYDGIFDAMRKMWRREGFLTFYRGILPSMMRSLPSGSVTMLIYELLSNLLSENKMFNK